MIKNFYMVRHGESTANAKEVHQGAHEELSEKGVKQAESVAERFTRIPIDAIYTSTMRRAHDTARAIHETSGAPLVESDLLIEVRRPLEVVGEHSNATHVTLAYEEIDSHFGESGWHYSDEENFDEQKTRGLEALALFTKAPYERVGVVSHGEFIRVLIALMVFGDALNPRELMAFKRVFRSTNTGITWCFYDTDTKDWTIKTWMDHAHLG